jgi:thioredoxin reductase
MSSVIEAAVVGGGPAGVQAALTLGRMHVNSVVFDDGHYRNATSTRMHNVLGWDGSTPAELREAGRLEIASYPWVRVVEATVSSARAEGSQLILTTSDSEWVVERVLLASGVQDDLLPIPGLRELWGDVVLPCPYCHGHEFAQGPIAVISSGGHADHIGALLRGLTHDVPVLAPEEVVAVTRSRLGVDIRLRDGAVIGAACVFIPANAAPRSSIAVGLGIPVTPDGIEVDPLGRTVRPGVWAAGDVVKRVDSRIPAAVITAMSSGLIAAADIAASVAANRDVRRASAS